MNQTIHICELCRNVLDPDEPGVVRAVQLLNADTLDSRGEIEGLGVFFHGNCWGQGRSGYRRKG